MIFILILFGLLLLFTVKQYIDTKRELVKLKADSKEFWDSLDGL